MRLVVTLPPGWPDEIPVRASELSLLPDEVGRWIDRTLREGAPAGARLEILANVERATETGWPMRIVEARVDGGLRVAAFYAFQEHGATAVARSADEATLRARRDELERIFAAARPDFSGEVACLAEIADIAAPAPRAATAAADTPAAPRQVDRARLEELLAAADPADAERRAEILLDLERPDEALAALTAAPSARAAELRGEAHAALGHGGEALAAWDQAAALDPTLTTAIYNGAQARYLREDFAGALAGFRRVAALAPDDVLVLRKVAQAELALGRVDDAEATRRLLRARWAASSDPRVRMIDEYVFDQFAAGPVRVHAYETLRAGGADFERLLTFRAVDAAGRDLPIQVTVETSAYARERGTPFVLGVSVQGRYRAVGAAPALPPYPQLRQTVIELVTEALAQSTQ